MKSSKVKNRNEAIVWKSRCWTHGLFAWLLWHKQSYNLFIWKVVLAHVCSSVQFQIRLCIGNTVWLDPLIKQEKLDGANTTVNTLRVDKYLLNNDLAEKNHQHLEKLIKVCKNGGIPVPIYEDSQGKFRCLWEFPHFILSIQEWPKLVMAHLPGSQIPLALSHIKKIRMKWRIWTCSWWINWSHRHLFLIESVLVVDGRTNVRYS